MVEPLARIGEVLIAWGSLEPAQVADALRAQVMWGGRLGTTLVELGYVGLDELASALGRRHGMPAALGRHIDHADRALRLPARLAERFACMPLFRAGDQVAIASMSPLSLAAKAAVAEALSVSPDHLFATIAPELRIRYLLEDAYGIARPPRFRRAHGTENDAIVPAPAPIPRARTADDRRYVVTLADLARTDAGEASARIADAPRLAAANSLGADAESGELAAALQQIEAAPTREDLARLAIDAIARFEPCVHAALLLVVRGTSATSWTGIHRHGAALPAIAVPLDRPGLVPSALRGDDVVRANAAVVGRIDELLLAALGSPHADLAVAPIDANPGESQAAAAFALAVEPNEPLAYVPAIARAASAGLARLIATATEPAHFSSTSRTRLSSSSGVSGFWTSSTPGSSTP